MELWFCLIVRSFVFGMTGLPGWAAIPLPLISIGVGIESVLTEPENYDMSGFGLHVGFFTALMCPVSWLIGRGFLGVLSRSHD